MNSIDLAPSNKFLTTAARKYFDNIYENPKMHISTQIDTNLGWTPSLHFKKNKFSLVAIEASELPYPQILKLRRAEVQEFQTPIEVYCVCPLESLSETGQERAVKELQAHGYGLITVDRDGVANRVFGCAPLTQHIYESEIVVAIKGLPKNLRIAVRESYDSYRLIPSNGVKVLSEILESLVVKAAIKAAKKGYITNAEATGTSAKVLDNLSNSTQLGGAGAAIGAARSYFSFVRNKFSHAPKTQKQAYTRLHGAKQGFHAGIKAIKEFRTAMTNSNITITYP